MKIDITKTSEIEKTLRVEMLGSMFDCPIDTKLSVRLQGELNLEDKKWNVGLIVGPSGSGKTLLLENLFGKPEVMTWNHGSVIDDFDELLSMEEITNVCSSVGFNTIPAWMRPFSVLSNGERFRAEIARRILTPLRQPIVVDEFTSVVDRQVAQIVSSSVAKYVRTHDRQIVAASCHYDIIDWLQPDWILEPGNPTRFTWRFLQPRPPITVSVSRVKYETWNLFKDFHYMSQDLNKAARCYGLFIGGRIVSFCGALYRPHPKVRDIIGISRIVTLPDFQGLGCALRLAGTLGAAYKSVGKRFHNYPNHPAMVRTYQRSRDWIQIKESGSFSPRSGTTSTVGGFGGKRCAVFMYTGQGMNVEEAKRLISGGVE